jgi:Zn-dependent M16 (insulinase) family peptidase
LYGDFEVWAASYCDPNVFASFEAFGKAAGFAEKYDAEDEELERAKITCLSRIDAPKKPADRFYDAVWFYMTETPDDFLRKYRDEVVQTDVGRIRALAPYIERAFEDASFFAAVPALDEGQTAFDTVVCLYDV